MGSIESALRGWRGLAEDGRMGLLRRRGATGTGVAQALSIPAVRQDAPLDGSDLPGAGLPHLGAGAVSYWAQPVGWALAMLLASGTIGGVGAGPDRRAARARRYRVAASLPGAECAGNTLWMDPVGPATGPAVAAMSNPKRRPTPTRWPQPGCRKTGALPSSPRRWATTRLLSAYGSATG